MKTIVLWGMKLTKEFALTAKETSSYDNYSTMCSKDGKKVSRAMIFLNCYFYIGIKITEIQLFNICLNHSFVLTKFPFKWRPTCEYFQPSRLKLGKFKYEIGTFCIKHLYVGNHFIIALWSVVRDVYLLSKFRNFCFRF